jgi:hypothetical protein
VRDLGKTFVSSESAPLAPPLHHFPLKMTAPPPTERGVLSDVVNSVFEPGTNAGLIKAMSWSFYALFATLLGMVWLTGGNWHVVSLLGLSIALFLSIKWCVYLPFLPLLPREYADEATFTQVHRTNCRDGGEAAEGAAGEGKGGREDGRRSGFEQGKDGIRTVSAVAGGRGRRREQ